MHRRGFRVISYISPQLWAWRSYRARNVRRDVDLLLSILPFEKDWYAARGMTHVEYVGHPLAGEVRASWIAKNFVGAIIWIPRANRRLLARQPSQGTGAHPAADA